MNDKELEKTGLKNDPLVLSQKELPKYEQFRYGVCIYKIVDDQYVLRDESEFESYIRSEQLQRKKATIEMLKTDLLGTDWCVLKCSELGLSMAELYPDVHLSRTEARLEINRLEMEIKTLEE